MTPRPEDEAILNLHAELLRRLFDGDPEAVEEIRTEIARMNRMREGGEAG